MSFYEINVALLVLLNVALYYRQSGRPATSTTELSIDEEISKALDPDDFEDSVPRSTINTFVKQYLTGHLLAFAGDWLQVCLRVQALEQ